MKKTTFSFLAASLFVLALVNPSFAEEEKVSAKIHGYMIPEYYFVLDHHTGDKDAGGISGQHGFWFRRIYLGYDQKFGDFGFRVRLEGNSPAFEEGTIVPFVKDLYLKYKLGSSVELQAGMYSPPTFDKIEDFWGYRHIEKTPLDLFKLASSRDIGFGISGGKNFIYTLMYANFGSNKGEDNQGKGFFGRLGYETETLYVEANGYVAADGDKDYQLFQGFAGIQGKWGNLGLNYAYKNQSEEGEEDMNTSLVSAFSTIKLGKKATLVVRYDHFLDPNLKDPGDYLPIASTTAAPRLLIVALDFKVHKQVQIGPNIKYVFYGDAVEGMEKPDADFFVGLTGKIKFESSL